MAIITKLQADKLIRSGKAAQVATTYQSYSDKTFGVIDNYELQRTDHYLIGIGDMRESAPETEGLK